jgi:hypothetical protein
VRQFLPLLLVSLSLQASTIYQVNRNVGIGFVQGTITTDDTVGVLSGSNIVAWDLTIHNGLASLQLSNTLASNSVFVAGTQFSATATELLFNFSALGNNFVIFDSNFANNYWCIETSGCTGASPAETVRIASNSVNVALSGSEVIGTTVPEPGTWALVALSGSALALLRRRSAFGAKY